MARHRLTHTLALAAAALLASGAARAAVSPGEAALLAGRADDATRLLRSQLAEHPEVARTHLLLCRVLLSEGLRDPAATECEAAATRDSSSSETQMWLGRAYGAKAAAANPLLAFPLARKVRTSFERAVALDPSSGPAISDLGEFYVQAPGVVGGGIDKARSLAARAMTSQPVRAHRLLAEIAERAGDLKTAEAEYRKAGASPPALLDLAQFFQTHHQPDQALTAVRSALAEDRLHGPELVDAAHILTKASRAPELAQTCLELYLASPARSDAAPAFRVHIQLGDLLAAKGDSDGAQAEYAAARALASAYTGHDGRRSKPGDRG